MKLLNKILLMLFLGLVIIPLVSADYKREVYDYEGSHLREKVNYSLIDSDNFTGGNGTFTGNLSAKWWNGLFNWTENSPYLSWTGSVLSFAESLMNSTIHMVIDSDIINNITYHEENFKHGNTTVEIQNTINETNINVLNINASSVTVLNNITTDDWFKGKFNWTSIDDWNIFDGSILDFNDSKLSTIYYNASLSLAIVGTIDTGTLADTQHSDGAYDGTTLNFTEASSSPALDLRINFTSIDDFNRGVIRYKTSSLSGLFPIIQMWNYDDSAWEDYPPLAETLTFATITQPVFDSSEHLEDGIAQMRIYKASNGNINNHYYVDWIAISKGYGTPSGEEIDPFSYHTDKNIGAESYNLTINYTCFNPGCTSRMYDNGSDLIIERL